MKKSVYLFIIMLLTPFLSSAQNGNQENLTPQLGDKAPKFKAESTNGRITFPNDFDQSWKILLSHPADFTPVCTSELLELTNYKSDFSALDAKIAIISTDKLEHHKLWIKSMNELSYKGNKNATFDFPLIADPKGEVALKYGMLHPKANTTKTVRGVLIIYPQNRIRSISYYPMAVGRNMDEIKRTVVALQKHDKENVLTPANWKLGEDVIVPFLSYTPELDEEKAKNADPNIYSVSWYLHMKPDKQ